MEFDCTKDGKNIYFACREKAAKYNDLLNSRERAAELLGISTSTLYLSRMYGQENSFPSQEPTVAGLVTILRSPLRNGKQPEDIAI